MSKNIIFSILLILLSIFITIFFIEILLRINNQGPWGQLNIERNDPIFNKPHKTLGWVPKEGSYKFQPFSEDGDKFEINILNDGSRKVTSKQINTNDDLIFLGGSITLGWGVNDNQTFASKLQDNISNYRIKNFSVGGYGTYQSFLRLEEMLSKSNDIKVVVAIYVPHHSLRNIGDEFWLRTLTKHSKRGFIELPYASIDDNQELVRHKPISYIKTPLRDKLAISNKLAKRIMKFRLSGNEQNRYLVTNEVFKKMNKITKEKKIKLVIANISDDKKALDPYLETLITNKIDYFNCNIEATDDLIIKGDGHPNDLLHSKFSSCIYQNLKQKIKII